VLNVNDLQTMLASSDTKVVTGSVAADLLVDAAFTWASAHSLTLDAYGSLTVNRAVSVAGPGGLTILYHDGGTGLFLFVALGRISFFGHGNTVSINGQPYTLVGNVATLASSIAADPKGNFALANNYDASADGTYAHPPVTANPYKGRFEGFGNTISNLTVSDATAADESVGLFAYTLLSIEHLRLLNANVQSTQPVVIGGLVGTASGTLLGDTVTGKVGTGGTPVVCCHNAAGGLVGSAGGSILYSRTVASVRGGPASAVGGLVGQTQAYGTTKITIAYSSATGGVVGGDAGGLIGDFVTNISIPGLVSHCFATGPVSAFSEAGGLIGYSDREIVGSFATGTVFGAYAGGLVGFSEAAISQSFATGAVSAKIDVGGLVGYSVRPINNSYATGPLTGGQNVGGLVGYNASWISASYSTGSVNGVSVSFVGGLIGSDQSVRNIFNTYWDTTTSGITSLSQGAGNYANDPGIKGLTNSALQAGLPPGFQSTVWGQSSTINGGLPYLLIVPPPH
jgi:hypothetical protein